LVSGMEVRDSWISDMQSPPCPGRSGHAGQVPESRRRPLRASQSQTSARGRVPGQPGGLDRAGRRTGLWCSARVDVVV